MKESERLLAEQLEKAALRDDVTEGDMDAALRFEQEFPQAKVEYSDEASGDEVNHPSMEDAHAELDDLDPFILQHNPADDPEPFGKHHPMEIGGKAKITHLDNAGGSTPEQYELPPGASELQDLIEHRDMNFAVGNIFKACYRKGTCAHSDWKRDLRKIIWFAKRELARG